MDANLHGPCSQVCLARSLFCRPHPSVLDRNTRSAINFCKETNGSRRFSDRKPMKRALPNTFSITKPRVACTLGWSSVHARMVVGHEFPSQTQRFASLFLTNTNGSSPAEHNFIAESRVGCTVGWSSVYRHRSNTRLRFNTRLRLGAR